MRKPFIEFIKNKISPPFVLITCGLPGTWKTETAAEISRIKGYKIFRSDLVRLEVLKNEDIFDEKVASNMEKRTLVYNEMFRMANELAGKGKGIILDATFITQSLRRRAAEVASKHNMTFIIQQTQCPKDVSISRILKRSKENYESNALTEQAYINNKNKFEQVDLDDLKTLFPNLNMVHLLIDTTSDKETEWFVIDRKMRQIEIL